MAVIDFHDLEELKNRNEELVWKALEEHLAAHPGLCRCRDCVLDAAAIALNRLPARYQVYSFHENSRPEDESGHRAGAAKAVAAACELVSKRPHHF